MVQCSPEPVDRTLLLQTIDLSSKKNSERKTQTSIRGPTMTKTVQNKGSSDPKCGFVKIAPRVQPSTVAPMESPSSHASTTSPRAIVAKQAETVSSSISASRTSILADEIPKYKAWDNLTNGLEWVYSPSDASNTNAPNNCQPANNHGGNNNNNNCR